MINNLLKISAFIVTGRFLKPRFKGLVTLIIYWLIVRFLHNEYLSYVEYSENTYFLWQAALLKIALYIAGLLIYGLVIERTIFLNDKQKNNIDNSKNQQEKEGDDGFNFLRKKKKLSSESQQLLNKKP